MEASRISDPGAGDGHSRVGKDAVKGQGTYRYYNNYARARTYVCDTR